MKFTLSFLFIFCCCSLNIAQTDSSKNQAIILELGGSGGIGSVNYERTFYSRPKYQMNWRAGLSFIPIDRNNGTVFIFPLMLNYLAGSSSHKVELGVGQGLSITTKGSFFSLTTLAAGYRFQPENKRWFLRVTYSPLISYIVDFQVQQWAGFSIGCRF